MKYLKDALLGIISGIFSCIIMMILSTMPYTSVSNAITLVFMLVGIANTVFLYSIKFTSVPCLLLRFIFQNSSFIGLFAFGGQVGLWRQIHTHLGLPINTSTDFSSGMITAVFLIVTIVFSIGAFLGNLERYAYGRFIRKPKSHL